MGGLLKSFIKTKTDSNNVGELNQRQGAQIQEVIIQMEMKKITQGNGEHQGLKWVPHPSPWAISSSGVHLLQIPFLTSCNLYLKNKNGQLLYQQNEFIQEEHRNCALHYMKIMVIQRQVQKTKERSIPLWRKRGSCQGLFRRQIHWRRTRVQDGDGLSLAGLLLGEEKIFFPPTGVM